MVPRIQNRQFHLASIQCTPQDAAGASHIEHLGHNRDNTEPHSHVLALIIRVPVHPNSACFQVDITNYRAQREGHHPLAVALENHDVVGSRFHEPGNAAEFNIFANPMAATRMLEAPVTKTIVPLDVTSQAVLSFDQFNRIKQSVRPNLKWFFEDLIPFALREHHEQLGLEGWPLREVAALAFLSQSRHFETSPMLVGIEQSGTLTRGATVIDQRRIPRWQTNCEVVESVDAQGVLDYFGQLARR